jgi:hypothetical protein
MRGKDHDFVKDSEGVSCDDGDALGNGARAAEAVDDPVSSVDGDALGD